MGAAAKLDLLKGFKRIGDSVAGKPNGHTARSCRVEVNGDTEGLAKSHFSRKMHGFDECVAARGGLEAPDVYRDAVGTELSRSRGKVFALGERTSWELTPSLEQQTSFYVDEALRRFQPNNPNAGISTQEEVASSRYVWGRTDVSEIPDTLQFLWTLRQGMPEGIEDQPETAYGRRTHMVPWPTIMFWLLLATLEVTQLH